jgi:hypothetical protein
MLTRGELTHQYGYAGYYAEPYHVLMLEDAYPPAEGAPRPELARVSPVPLNAAVLASGGAGFRPYVGMDPTDPGTYTRPYNPQPSGLFARMHQEQAQAVPQRAGQPRPRKRNRGAR